MKSTKICWELITLNGIDENIWCYEFEEKYEIKIYILVLKKTLKCEIEQTCNKEITNFLKTNSDY